MTARRPLASRLLDRTPEIVLLAVTTAAGLAARGRWLNPIGDTGMWWSLLTRLSEGQRLYDDVYLQYGPLSPYLLLAGGRVFGLTAAYMTLSSWAAAIVCALLLLSVARRIGLSVGERLAAALLIVALSLFGPGVSPLVLSYSPAAVHAVALAFAAFCLADGAGERPWRAAAAGLAAGLAVCAKPEIGFAACGCMGVGLVLARSRLRALAAAAAGFAAPVAAALVFVLRVDPVAVRRSHLWPLVLDVPRAWKELFRIMMGVTGPDWALLVRGSAWTLLALCAAVGVAGLALGRERDWRGWVPVGVLGAVVGTWWLVEGYLVAGRFFPLCLSVFVSLAVAGWAFLDRRLPPRQRALLVAFGLFAAANGARSIFSTELYGPYGKVSQLAASVTWVVFACRLLPASLARTAPAASAMRRITVALALAVSAFVAVRSIPHLEPPGLVPLATRAGTVYVGDGMRAFLERLGRESRPGQSAAILPEVNALDVFYGLHDRSPWLGHTPGWLDTEAERALIERFGASPPDVIVVFDRPTWLYRTAPFGIGYGRELSAWISTHYDPIVRAPEGQILRRRAS